MKQLIELYEMVAMNDIALRGTEKLTILKARLALRMFERAMESFRREQVEAPNEIEVPADLDYYRLGASAAPAAQIHD
jgi:hypothetical protein